MKSVFRKLLNVAAAAVISVAFVLPITAGAEPFPGEPDAPENMLIAPAPDSFTEPEQENDVGGGLGLLAAALAVGLACVGAGIAIASTAPAAIGAFSEDPKSFGKTLIFVVLGEGIALYGLLISILIINKV